MATDYQEEYMPSKTRMNDWDAFKANPNPLAKIREIKSALPNGPGLPAMYDEIQTSGTVFGIPVLTLGKRIYVPRQRVIEKIEGSDAQTAA